MEFNIKRKNIKSDTPVKELSPASLIKAAKLGEKLSEEKGGDENKDKDVTQWK